MEPGETLSHFIDHDGGNPSWLLPLMKGIFNGPSNWIAGV
jgi:hypothetical protein